jgi:hypothetical protein
MQAVRTGEQRHRGKASQRRIGQRDRINNNTSIRRRQKKCATLSIKYALADNLASVINVLRVGKVPSRVYLKQAIEVNRAPSIPKHRHTVVASNDFT